MLGPHTSVAGRECEWGSWQHGCWSLRVFCCCRSGSVDPRQRTGVTGAGLRAGGCAEHRLRKEGGDKIAAHCVVALATQQRQGGCSLRPRHVAPLPWRGLRRYCRQACQQRRLSLCRHASCACMCSHGPVPPPSAPRRAGGALRYTRAEQSDGKEEAGSLWRRVGCLTTQHDGGDRDDEVVGQAARQKASDDLSYHGHRQSRARHAGNRRRGEEGKREAGGRRRVTVDLSAALHHERSYTQARQLVQQRQHVDPGCVGALLGCRRRSELPLAAAQQRATPGRLKRRLAQLSAVRQQRARA